MTVYVYKLEGQRGRPFTSSYPFFPWYGLTADTAEELHSFAESIGQYRSFYRPYRSDGAEVPLVGHYDINQGERDRAVDHGARPISTRAQKKRLREKAAAHGVRLD
jgi:hypothetical protein